MSTDTFKYKDTDTYKSTGAKKAKDFSKDAKSKGQNNKNVSKEKQNKDKNDQKFKGSHVKSQEEQNKEMGLDQKDYIKIKAVWEYYDGESGGKGIVVKCLHQALKDAGAVNLDYNTFIEQITGNHQYKENTNEKRFKQMMQDLQKTLPGVMKEQQHHVAPKHIPNSMNHNDLMSPNQDLMTPQNMNAIDYNLNHLDVNAHADEITDHITGNRDHHWNQVQSIIGNAYRGNDYANQFKIHHGQMVQVIHGLENTVGALENDYMRSMARNKELVNAGRLQSNYNMELSNALNNQQAKLQQRNYLEARLAQLKEMSQNAGRVQAQVRVTENASNPLETGRQFQNQNVMPQYQQQFAVPQQQYVQQNDQVVPNNFVNTSQNPGLRRSRSFIGQQKNWVNPNKYLNTSQNVGLMRRSKSYGDLRYKNLRKSNVDGVRSLGTDYVDDFRPSYYGGRKLSSGNPYLNDVQQDWVLPAR